MEEHADIKVPRPALYGVIGLMVLTTLFAAVAQPAPDPVSAAAVTRTVAFATETTGLLVVTDGGSGQELGRFGPETAGFVRGALRALERERRLRDAANTAPYALVAEPNGRLLLTDPVTGVRVDLAAFGSDNVAIFRQLLARAQ